MQGQEGLGKEERMTKLSQEQAQAISVAISAADVRRHVRAHEREYKDFLRVGSVKQDKKVKRKVGTR